MNKKVVVVGTGFSGGILARKIAEDLELPVRVVEKRSHIGGNMFDEYDERGILVQRYGPHFLNTNKYFVIKFLKQYGELFEHNTKLISFIDNKYIRLPFNFQTVQQFVGAEKSESLLKKLRSEYADKGRDRVPVLELIDNDDAEISAYGTILFEKAYKTYTSKQWGVPVEKIDKYVLDRVPMAMNYDERYLNKDFQYLPVHGFTRLFDNMLGHKNINVELNTDALEHITFDNEKRVIKYDGEALDCLIFTGPIDELFDYKFGVLPYRSLDIKYDYSDSDSVLPAEIVSYPQAKGYTRKTEYRKIMHSAENVRGSVVATEYPLEYKKHAEMGNTPYYPVLTDESKAVYLRYIDEAKNYRNLFLCGRLAEFKYYNMDICIEHALEYYSDVKAYLTK